MQGFLSMGGDNPDQGKLKRLKGKSACTDFLGGLGGGRGSLSLDKSYGSRL